MGIVTRYSNTLFSYKGDVMKEHYRDEESTYPLDDGELAKEKRDCELRAYNNGHVWANNIRGVSIHEFYKTMKNGQMPRDFIPDLSYEELEMLDKYGYLPDYDIVYSKPEGKPDPNKLDRGAPHLINGGSIDGIRPSFMREFMGYPGEY